MSAKHTITRWLPYLLIPLFLIGSSVAQKRLHGLRVEHRLTDFEVAEDAPPLVVFTTVALGSFRGLIADFLWLYSGKMQEQGNYFELVQLASWMVKLQPRFTGATAYLAWNMAYNVSVTFSGFEDRWRWVRRGIELIRDEALLYNPGDPELYKELGWIYQHKLGQEMDDANRYYKFMLANEITTYLGGYPVDWQLWAATPTDEAGLLAALGPDSSLLADLALQGYDLKRLEREFRASQGKLPDAVQPAVAASRQAPLLERYLRGRWLRHDLKLDPVKIHRLHSQFGDLDWRLPEAHAIYWASLGLNRTNELVNLACERMIFQSLSNAFRGGRLAYGGSLEGLEVTPNTSLVDAVNQQYLDSMAKHPNNQSIRSGYRNWLIDATVILFAFGQETKAAEYYAKLRLQSNDPKHRRPLEEFAIQELAGDIASATFDQAHAAVQGYLYQCYLALAVGDDDRAQAFDLIARRIWEKYTQQIGGGRSQERRGLPELRSMKTTMFQRCLERFPPDLAARLRQAAINSGLTPEPAP